MAPNPTLQRLAIPGVSALIAFLAYTPQVFLFPAASVGPGPLSKNQKIVFNALLTCLWVSFFRAWWTDPGRVPEGWVPALNEEVADGKGKVKVKGRWCRKCESWKPARAHHCRVCKRCIPKMDHHCPWTANCVSHTTFPHFLRFVLYAVLSMAYLEALLYTRVAEIWRNRHLPSYLGPSVYQLTLLFIILMVNSLVLFALSILLVRSVWTLVVNVYSIESWEIERHEALVRRAKILGGYVEGPNGVRLRIQKQEFPYDVGLWKNVRQGMGGSANILSWFWPFAATPSLESGLDFEVNGFEDASLPWPPPDPDRMSRPSLAQQQAFIYDDSASLTATKDEEIAAFRRRQQEDMKRWDSKTQPTTYQQPQAHAQYGQYESEDEEDAGSANSLEESDSGDDYEGWTNSEGDRLRDFGVDEDAEYDDEEDIPLAEIIRRRRAQAPEAGAPFPNARPQQLRSGGNEIPTQNKKTA